MGDDGEWQKIADAKHSRDMGKKLKLMGVVLDSTIPKMSKGTDFCCTLKIVDESHSAPGLTVVFFAQNIEKLPLVLTAGDIIQLSRVKMQTHEGEVFAVFNKRMSEFALYEGKHSTNFVPYQASPKFLPRNQEDTKLIASLRKWSEDNYPATGSNPSLSLKEIVEGEEVNLVCKVLHVCEVTKDEWSVLIWDGTDTPPLTVQSQLEDEIKNPLPLHMDSLPLSRDVLCTFPTVGTILSVVVDQSKEKLGLHLLKVGRWVKFVGIRFQCHVGLWRASFLHFTRLQYLSNDDHHVLMLLKLYGERMNSRWNRGPALSSPSSQITETDYEGAPFFTLMNVLTSDKVVVAFKCVVRVVAICPWQAENFQASCGTYRIRLTLEDPTARIHAFVFAEDGVKFFGGDSSIDKLRRMRNKLLGISEDGSEENMDGPRNPPWIKCCIQAYYTSRDDKWGSRNYRIYATRLLR